MTELVGIVNVTPDSFSGDGLHGQVNAALARIDALMESGAAVIDIGAESTRPGAMPLAWQEEWERLSPILSALGARRSRIKFSIDTRHSETALRALEAGFHWINDVSGGNAAMLAFTKTHDFMWVIMHSVTVPADPVKTIPADADPVEVVMAWAEKRIAELERQRIARSRIILDPGIGFGKTAEQSLALIKNIARFKALGTRLLVGHSRKSFLSLFAKPPMRDAGTLAVSYYLASQGVDYLRVHDVESHATMLRVKNTL